MYIYIYIYTCINTHTHTHLHVCFHTYACMHVYVYIYMHIHTYIHTCMHACMYVCMYVYIYIYICAYIYIYVHMNICYIYIYTHTYIDVHTYTHMLYVCGGVCKFCVTSELIYHTAHSAGWYLWYLFMRCSLSSLFSGCIPLWHAKRCCMHNAWSKACSFSQPPKPKPLRNLGCLLDLSL